MGKCQCITDGFPCGQEERTRVGDFGKVVGTEVCYYHQKMMLGLILPFREQDIKVTFKGRTINKH